MVLRVGVGAWWPVVANFNRDSMDASGGFGAGFGFGIECAGQSVFSWGTGFGGGVNAVSGQQSVRQCAVRVDVALVDGDG